jgi:tetratricopeptide (TPR) repeat protein
MSEFQQELRLNPGHAEAAASAGSMLLGEQQTDKAIPYLRKALQMRPELMLAHRELGKALYQRGQLSEAEQELKAALADDPEGNVHYVLAEVYRDSGRKAEAHAAFEEARRIKMERDETDMNEKAGAGEP